MRRVNLSYFAVLACLVLLWPVKGISQNEATDPEPARLQVLPSLEQENDRLSAKFGFFKQNDGRDNSGGNPNIDEDATVYETLIVVDKEINERDQLQVRFLVDLVSSASISKFDNPRFRALQSNPSGNEHFELGANWQRQYDGYSAGVNASLAWESSEWFAAGYGSNIALPFNKNNSIFSLKLQGYFDSFVVKLFTGDEDGIDERYTYSVETGLQHILTPKTVLDLRYNHTSQFGFLATTHNSVLVNGFGDFEKAPHSRHRNSITTRIKQSLAENTAIEFAYRFYDDNWSLDSHTFDTRFFQYILDRKVLLEPNYRNYNQSAVFFHAEEFSDIQEFQTSDSDLSSFDGNLYGFRVTLIRPQFLEQWKADLDLSYNFYDRSDDLDFWWATIGYSMPF